MFVPQQDWIVQNSSTTGLGDFELSGDPPIGTSYFPFRHRFANGATVPTYWVVNPTRSKWEVYRNETLTYGTLDELSRANIDSSTNSDGKVNWQPEDMPLLIYIVPDVDAAEFAVTMGLGAARPDVLRFGVWADEDGLATDFDQLKHFDGTSDDVIGVVNRVAHKATIYGLPPGYLYGMTLSRSSATAIGIAAGVAMDSTNVVGIRLAAAITKSTAGAWAAGSTQNGMGDGLTIANSTWYHVFAILNAGLADVYFDTSVTAANKPTGTTHFRRLGSFKTNGSAQIIDFVEDGDLFQWLAPSLADYNVLNPGTSAVSATLNVPTGVNVQAEFQGLLANSDASNANFVVFSDLATTDTAPADPAAGAGYADSSTAAGAAGAVLSSGARYRVRTNTSAQIRARLLFSSGAVRLTVNTIGWIDRRGRD